MKKGFYISIIIVLSAVLLTGCFACSNNPLSGDIKVFSGTGKGETQSPADTISNPNATPAQTAQSKTETNERKITITDSNSVFSIGVPKGYKEERQVTAEKPIDFWFEYIGENVTLTVDGNILEVPVRRTTAKLGYKSGVTSFNYSILNSSSAATSYNLRMTPSKAGDSVPAVTREKWTAP
jgi:hypothetical protein